MLHIIILVILSLNSVLKGNFIDDKIMFIESPNTMENLSLFRSSPTDKDLQQTQLWEIKSAIAEIITQHAEIANHDTCDAMILHWLSGILIQAGKTDEAIVLWRRLAHDKASTVPAKYKAVFELPDAKIAELYSLAQSYMQQDESVIMHNLQIRRASKWGQQENDLVQFNGIPTERTLAILKKTGIQIEVLDEHMPLLQQILSTHPNKPLLDILKNKRILTVNDLINSKVAFTIHDLFDHFWLLNILEQNGFLERYADFFKNLGNPQHKDIFSREGESIASIGFEYRLALESHDYTPLFTINDIKNVLTPSQTENQKRAYNLLLTEFTDPTQEHMLRTVYSGMMIELMEQRRKNGFIKIYENDILKSMESSNPEYTALIVETCSLLSKSKTNTHTVLLNLTLLAEEILRKKAINSYEEPLTVTMDTIETFDATKSFLEPELITWYKNHLGFAATRKILSINDETEENTKETIQNMNIEYEAKFFIDANNFKTQLRALGATKVSSEVLMRRVTFNLGDNKWARVRDEGNRVTMTIKSLLNADAIDGVYETELVIDSFDKGCAFLQVLGLQKKSYQENYREQWEFASCELSIDRWPGLPVFVEIEGADAHTVNEVVTKLGLDPAQAMFGSIDLIYEKVLNIPHYVFNKYPQITFEEIDKLAALYGAPQPNE